MPKYEGWKKISFLSIPEVGEKKKVSLIVFPFFLHLLLFTHFGDT